MEALIPQQAKNPTGRRTLRATPRPLAIVAIIIAAVAVGVAFGSYYSLCRGSPQKTASICSDPYSTESHIYNPDRLVVYRDCHRPFQGSWTGLLLRLTVITIFD